MMAAVPCFVPLFVNSTCEINIVDSSISRSSHHDATKTAETGSAGARSPTSLKHSSGITAIFSSSKAPACRAGPIPLVHPRMQSLFSWSK